MKISSGTSLNFFCGARRNLLSSVPIFLFICTALVPNAGQTSGNTSSLDTLQSRRETLSLAVAMLRARGVPFDPELLIDLDWRSELAPALELMPEMRDTLHLKGALKGVYLADTVLLADHLTLAGDTFILARDFGPEEENTAIDIAGPHSIFIYVIDDPKKNAAMARTTMPPMLLNIDAMTPMVIVVIPPRYIGRQTYRGRPGYPAQGLLGGFLMPTTVITPSGIPHLLDPDFEAFRVVRDPLSGWYAGDAAGVTMTPDTTMKAAQGKYSLRLAQPVPRGKQEPQAFLAQEVRLPKAGALTRDFDLSVESLGTSKEPAIIEVYACTANQSPQTISRKQIKLRRIWATTRMRFTVPARCDQFGIRFYLPRAVTELWLDDVRLAPAIMTQP